MRKMRSSALLCAAFIAVWVAICIFTHYFSTILIVLEFAYFILPFTVFAIPLCIGHIASSLLRPTLHLRHLPKERIEPPFAIFTAIVGFAAYSLSVAVVGRFLELTWRRGKFGESSLSLGLSASFEYSGLAALVLLVAWAIFKMAPRNSWASGYAIGSIGMVLFSSTIYLLFGLSPFVQWRS